MTSQFCKHILILTEFCFCTTFYWLSGNQCKDFGSTLLTRECCMAYNLFLYLLRNNKWFVSMALLDRNKSCWDHADTTCATIFIKDPQALINPIFKINRKRNSLSRKLTLTSNSNSPKWSQMFAAYCYVTRLCKWGKKNPKNQTSNYLLLWKGNRHDVKVKLLHNFSW